MAKSLLLYLSSGKSGYAMIPYWIIEEHHEAFYVWHRAIKSKIIPPRGNLLLHIDEHSDLGIPLLNVDINSLKLDLDRIQNFVYQELSIINFIYPAFYLGIFDRFYWLKQVHDRDIKPRKLFVSSHNKDGKTLKVTSQGKLGDWWQTDRKCIQFYPVTAQQTNLNLKLPLVLDIDLDYFSCNNSLGSYFEVEITADAYHNLKNNYYHKARLNLGNELKIVAKEDKYFLCTEITDYEPNLKVSTTEITDRIDQLGQFLQNNQIKPAMITICRSRFSNYTPSDQWQFIEEKLLDRLDSLYSMQLINAPLFGKTD